MAFTLIAISKLDKANYKVIFYKSICTIVDPKGKTVATIPHSDGLYRITGTKTAVNEGLAATVSAKMSISEAHKKLGHISYGAITHAISKGLVTGIELDNNSKPDFCEEITETVSIGTYGVQHLYRA